MHTVYLGLGANLGNRIRNLSRALDELERAGCSVEATSAYHLTKPVGGPSNQPAYVNACACVRTAQSPEELLQTLQAIERALGRVRRERWGPRPIDLDILLWDTLWIETPQLQIPHPWLPVRRFVLEPLAEIAPALSHPSGWSITQQAQRLRQRPIYLALTGALGAGKTTLARAFAKATGAYLIEEVFDQERLARVYAGDRTAAADVQAWFLQSRCELLCPDRIPSDVELVVSDFWFGQSAAYAMVELDDAERDSHVMLVRQKQSEVLVPTVVVWLDVPADELWRRVQHRGRWSERQVDRSFLQALSDAFRRVLYGPPGPPTVRLGPGTVDELVHQLRLIVDSIA